MPHHITKKKSSRGGQSLKPPQRKRKVQKEKDFKDLKVKRKEKSLAEKKVKIRKGKIRKVKKGKGKIRLFAAVFWWCRRRVV